MSTGELTIQDKFAIIALCYSKWNEESKLLSACRDETIDATDMDEVQLYNFRLKSQEQKVFITRSVYDKLQAHWPEVGEKIKQELGGTSGS